MKKFEIIKLHKDFDKIIHNGSYKKNKYYIIYNKERDLSFPKFGIAVGKKLGNAVTRNKVKRQVRMIIKNNRDYIIIVKKSVLDISYQQMNEELKGLIEE